MLRCDVGFGIVRADRLADARIKKNRIVNEKILENATESVAKTNREKGVMKIVVENIVESVWKTRGKRIRIS